MALAMNQLVHHLAMCIIDENDLETYQSLKDSTTVSKIETKFALGVNNGMIVDKFRYCRRKRSLWDGFAGMDLES